MTKETYVVDMSRGPNVKLRPVPVGAVRIRGGFWRERMTAGVAGVHTALGKLEKSGALDNFRIAAGRKKGTFRGPCFMDSDVYKWLDAASMTLMTERNPALEAQMNEAIEIIAEAQEKDGYLNTYCQLGAYGPRWRDIRSAHEFYCAGHLFQAAVAHCRATGSESLLNVACRFADYLCETFHEGGTACAPGHPEVEMALVELYRQTGRKRYLALARFLIDCRGTDRSQCKRDLYCQDHLPVREQTHAIGHAVRDMYLRCGMTDVYAEEKDENLMAALRTVWKDMVHRRTYIHGALGSRYAGEAFGDPYELPNLRAYAESCAQIGGTMWSWRMLAIEAEARYADLMETQLYNSILSGVSLDGERYFYQNPLESIRDRERQEWLGCACCPTNLMRTIASVPGYLASTSDEGVFVHLYADAQIDWHLASGKPLELDIATDYPWSGDVEIVLGEHTAGTFGLFLRIPGWCRSAAVTVNGKQIEEASRSGGYLRLVRDWRPGDRVGLSLKMPVEVVQANPRLREAFGCVALKRGPIVYCFEEPDNPGVELPDLRLPLRPEAPGEGFEPAFRADLLGGVTVLEGKGRVPERPDGDRPLYAAFRAEEEAWKPVRVCAIPYYAWANRGPAHMKVWLPWVAVT